MLGLVTSQEGVFESKRAVASVTKGCTISHVAASDAVAVAIVFDLRLVNLSW